VNESEFDLTGLLVPGRAVVLVTRSGPPLRIRGQVYLVDRDFFTLTITEDTGAAPEEGMILGGAVFAARGVYRFACRVVMYRPGKASPLVLSPPESFEWIDRRMHPRLSVSIPLTCVPVVTAADSRADAAGFLGTTLDLSVGGLSINTTHPVRPGQELRVAFTLPGGDHVTARTTVVSVHPAEAPVGAVVAHMQIDEIDARHRERLGAFVHEALFLAGGVTATERILRRPLVGVGPTG
jgi:hypothetical protein